MFNNIGEKLKIGAKVFLVAGSIYIAYLIFMLMRAIFSGGDYISLSGVAGEVIFSYIITVVLVFVAVFVGAFIIYGFGQHLEKQEENNLLLEKIIENTSRQQFRAPAEQQPYPGQAAPMQSLATDEQRPVNRWKCPACGNENSEKSAVCVFCGAKH